MTYKIPLIRDTINSDDICKLIEWLKTNPQLTKGTQTVKFESAWCEWNNTRYSTYVNSGSSANLIAYYALLLSNRLKNKKVIVPAVSWATTVAPIIQLGLEPIMCDCNMEDLGLDIEYLKKLVNLHNPGLIVTVNVLGFSNNYEQIIKICKDNNILLLEDSCESIGTVYNGKKTGNFGDISTFSYYFGHHMSTIEGGMVCTNDKELHELIVSLRAHGWDRDLSLETKNRLRKENNVDEFKALYTFYYPGFNFRSTDLQAFIGLLQMNRINDIVAKRSNNFEYYNLYLKNGWNLDKNKYQVISNFAFPIIHKNIGKIIQDLKENSVETRPLICGSMGKQPFWINRYGETSLKNADVINNFGIYLPNNPSMTQQDVKDICTIINKYI
jgi:CDP-6-deoxy-D-xylo-4-hexulose-3-dehydrase